MIVKFLNTINDNDITQLIKAIKEKNISVVKTFLYYGADPNICIDSGTTPLMIAAEIGITEIVYILLEYNADPTATNKDGNTPLIYASIYNHIQSVQLLLKKIKEKDISKINHKNNNGWSALLYSSSADNDDISRLLLNDSGDVNDQTTDGITPIMFAGIYQNKEYIKNLLKYNANLYIRNSKQQTLFDIEQISDDIKKFIRIEKYN